MHEVLVSLQQVYKEHLKGIAESVDDPRMIAHAEAAGLPIPTAEEAVEGLLGMCRGTIEEIKDIDGDPKDLNTAIGFAVAAKVMGFIGGNIIPEMMLRPLQEMLLTIAGHMIDTIINGETDEAFSNIVSSSNLKDLNDIDSILKKIEESDPDLPGYL